MPGMITDELAQKWLYWTSIAIPSTIDKDYAYWNGETWEENTESKLLTLKAKKINQLWSNYKAFQRKYVDPEDLTMATTLSLAQKPMGTAVRNWVFQLWDAYYTVKSQIEDATTVNEVDGIGIHVTLNAPPYTIKQLNEEAKEVAQMEENQNA